MTVARGALLAALVAVAPHLGALANGFAYDDGVLILGDPGIRRLAGLGQRLGQPSWPGAFGDTDTILTALVEDHPSSGRGWFGLGQRPRCRAARSRPGGPSRTQSVSSTPSLHHHLAEALSGQAKYEEALAGRLLAIERGSACGPGGGCFWLANT